MEMFMQNTHFHLTTWIIGIILFFVTFAMLKGGNPKVKMMHMVTRLFYILIFLSGGMLISDFGAYALKMFVGIAVIAFMEFVLVRTKKEKPTAIFWTLFVVLFVYVVYLGLSLPRGFDWF